MMPRGKKKGLSFGHLSANPRTSFFAFHSTFRPSIRSRVQEYTQQTMYSNNNVTVICPFGYASTTKKKKSFNGHWTRKFQDIRYFMVREFIIFMLSAKKKNILLLVFLCANTANVLNLIKIYDVRAATSYIITFWK